MHVIENIAVKQQGYVADTWYYPDLHEKQKIASVRMRGPPNIFSIIGFSCAFELDYPNVPRMLQMASIAQTAKERLAQRKSGNRVPAIVAGGVAVSSNPLVLLPFLDFIFIFDAERTFTEFLQNYMDRYEETMDLEIWWKKYTGTKRGIIPAFKYADGMPLEELFTKDACKWDARPLDAFDVPLSQELLDPEDPSALGTSYLLEIGRGCGEGCRFCLIGNHQRPPRFKSQTNIRASMQRLKTEGHSFRKIALISTNVADHPELQEICSCILENGYKISIPSTKPCGDDSMLRIIEAAGIQTITIAPETGSERLRMVAGKKITNAEFESTVSGLTSHGVTTIKIYLLFGLPSELPSDLDETITFLEKLREITSKRGTKIHVTLNPFIPKLGTPFMFHVQNFLSTATQAFKKTYEAFAVRIEKACRGKVDVMNLKEARMQAVLSLGGVELAPFLRVMEQAGRNASKLQIPEEIIDEVFLNIVKLLDRSDFPRYLSNIIPVSSKFLIREWQDAMKGLPSARCQPPGSCSRCMHVNCSDTNKQER